jgi:uncharacterized protein YbaR (Trm112 family)
MLERVVRQLACPVCGGSLRPDLPRRKVGGRLRHADLGCRDCHRVYGIQDGIGLLACPLADGHDWRVDPAVAEALPDDRRWREYLASLPPEVPGIYDEIARRLRAELEGVDGLVADLATCTGHVLRGLPPEAGGRRLVLGLDPEAAPLYAAQGALRRERRYTSISLAQFDPAHWPLPRASLAAIVSFFGPLTVPGGPRWMAEAARTLRERAPLAFGTLLSEEGTATLQEARRLRLDGLLTKAHLERALRRTGFHLETWEVLGEGRHWPGNPYDPLPKRGDPWRYVYVRARRGRTPRT